MLWISIFQICVSYIKQIHPFFLWLSPLCVCGLQWSENFPQIMSVIINMDHLKLLKDSRYKEILLILSFSGDSVLILSLFFTIETKQKWAIFLKFWKTMLSWSKGPWNGCFLTSVYLSYWCGPGCSFSSKPSDHLSIHPLCILNVFTLTLKMEGECSSKMSPKQPGSTKCQERQG